MEEEIEYFPTNREKSRRTPKNYRICWTIECERTQAHGGCENCDWEKRHSKAMKELNKAKKQDSI